MTQSTDRRSHQGRIVLVTGAGQGIGAAIARAFGKRGAAVGVLDMSAPHAEAVAAEIRDAGGAAASIAADVADYTALEAACGRLRRELGGPFDILVNNAGISPKHEGRAHAVWEMAPEEWNRVVGVNLTGCFNTVRLLSPAMRAAGKGAIVNMSSIAGRAYMDIVGVHYSATKAALIGFTRHLAGLTVSGSTRSGRGVSRPPWCGPSARVPISAGWTRRRWGGSAGRRRSRTSSFTSLRTRRASSPGKSATWPAAC
jgi:3-oxoacyl-[acyl-carrier protein] reductase